MRYPFGRLADDRQDAYKRLSKYTVLPLENTIYGPVHETIDCLFTRTDVRSDVDGDNDNEDEDNGTLPDVLSDKMIVAALDLPISHCLVVKKGTMKDQIKWVRSHEQVRRLHRCGILTYRKSYQRVSNC